MKMHGKRMLFTGVVLIALFCVWTVLVQRADVQRIGETGTEVGFAAVNGWVHALTGVNMTLYEITDWLGLVPVVVCLGFGVLGAAQLVRRKSLMKVDGDIVLLGVYYLIVICGYVLFEMIPINYRPVFIEGRLEASYPSSTTLLVLSVMPTAGFQVRRRVKNIKVRNLVSGVVCGFSAFMVLGRLISGVHWATDIFGAVLMGMGLFCVYSAVVISYVGKEK